MFGNNRRVEEDLERIRAANLPPKPQSQISAEEKIAKENLEKVGGKEYLSMTLAALSIVLPYVLIFGAMLFMIWLLVTIWAR